jgi:hypothetical protein
MDALTLRSRNFQSEISRPILVTSFRGSRSRQGWDNGILNRLWVDLELGRMMVMVVMAVVYFRRHLRLCRIGYRETEGEHETEQNSFHNLVSPFANQFTELL